MVQIPFVTSIAKQIVPVEDQLRFGRITNRTALGLSSADSGTARFATLAHGADGARDQPTLQAVSTADEIAGSGQPVANREGCENSCLLSKLSAVVLAVRSTTRIRLVWTRRCCSPSRRC